MNVCCNILPYKTLKLDFTLSDLLNEVLQILLSHLVSLYSLFLEIDLRMYITEKYKTSYWKFWIHRAQASLDFCYRDLSLVEFRVGRCWIVYASNMGLLYCANVLSINYVNEDHDHNETFSSPIDKAKTLGIREPLVEFYTRYVQK